MSQTMNQPQVVQLTQEGYDEIVAELKLLKDEKLPTAIQRVATARSFGDLSENAEYHSSREDLSFIEGRVSELEAIVTNAKIIKNGKKSQGMIDLGSKVTVKVGREKHIYHIVGEWEANPLEKKISHQSPLGKALLGKAKGDAVEITVPAGTLKYVVVSVD
ncbi:MAG TPA: transcription elongation factor GreA [Patescibacteria group bacterium]|nr:transcription elongation factor GreA [Patescibacteria group bacterium]